MNDFAHVLRRVDRKLELPEPQRSRILLEIAQDLEELRRTYRASGYSEAEARARAEALCGVGDASLDELARVHAPAYARLLSRFSSRAGHRIERLLLTFVTFVALAAGIFSLTASGLLRAPSPLLWPLLAVVAGSAWVAAAAFLSLHLRPYRPPRPGDLTLLTGLAAASVTLGAMGVLLEADQLAASIEATQVVDARSVVAAVRRSAQLLTLSLTLSLAVLVVWFQLRRRALDLQRLRVAADRLTHPPSPEETS